MTLEQRGRFLLVFNKYQKFGKLGGKWQDENYKCDFSLWSLAYDRVSKRQPRGQIWPTICLCTAHKLGIVSIFLNSREKNIKWIFCDTLKLYDIQILVLISKILLEHTTLTHLHIIYVIVFHTTRAELGVYNRDHLDLKPQIFTMWTFKENSHQAPA